MDRCAPSTPIRLSSFVQQARSTSIFVLNLSDLKPAVLSAAAALSFVYDPAPYMVNASGSYGTHIMIYLYVSLLSLILQFSFNNRCFRPVLVLYGTRVTPKPTVFNTVSYAARQTAFACLSRPKSPWWYCADVQMKERCTVLYCMPCTVCLVLYALFILLC